MFGLANVPAKDSKQPWVSSFRLRGSHDLATGIELEEPVGGGGAMVFRAIRSGSEAFPIFRPTGDFVGSTFHTGDRFRLGDAVVAQAAGEEKVAIG